MKILILCDSFKETATSFQVVSTIAEGIKEIYPSATIDCQPFSDGGEGSLDVMKSLFPDSVEKEVPVIEPSLQCNIPAHYLINKNSSFIESAQACGLERTHRKNPMVTSTYGLGMLLKEALKEKKKEVAISLGGSATDDFGVGMMQALGVKFSKEDGREFLSPIQGKDLVSIKDISLEGLDPNFPQSHFRLLSDVRNPLLGKEGATSVFAPQKGASKEDCSILESGIANVASLLEKKAGKKIKDIPGAGAAGGLGGAFLAYSNDVEILSGGKCFLSLVEKKYPFASYDLIITGEGKIDRTTLDGKCVSIIAQEAKKSSVPCLAIGGYVEPEVTEGLRKIGVTSFLSMQKKKRPIAELKATAIEDLRQAVVEYFKCDNLEKITR